MTVLALTALVILIFGIFFSHKIAGPVFKLKRYLNSIKEGNFSERVKFRKSDYLEELEQILNRAVAKLQARQNADMEMIAPLRETLDSLSAAIDTDPVNSEEFRELARRIASEARKILAMRERRELAT